MLGLIVNLILIKMKLNRRNAIMGIDVIKWGHYDARGDESSRH